MAAFTTMALMGAAAAGGMFAAKKLSGAKKDTTPGSRIKPNGDPNNAPVIAPAPVNTPKPPDAVAAASSAVGAGVQAAGKTRRKAMAGLNLPSVGRRRNPQAHLAPRSLLGS